MLLKLIRFNFLTIFIVNFFIFTFTANAKFKKFDCLFLKTEPPHVLNLLPRKDGFLYIDFINKQIKYFDSRIKVENLKFHNDQVTWYYRFNNPVTDKPRITFSYFFIKTGEFIQHTYDDKENLTQKDLRLIFTAKCK